MVDTIVILDFGSQYTLLISRRLRELSVYSEILPYNAPIEKIKQLDTKGIILSGSPYSVYQKDAPKPDDGIFKIGVPILGICYGMQYVTQKFGGKVQKSKQREYGRAEIKIDPISPLFDGMEHTHRHTVWMSHSDRIEEVPEGFSVIASSANSPIAGFQNQSKQIIGLQFHPEVSHTEEGIKILNNFARHCNVTGKWDIGAFVENSVIDIKNRIGNDSVIGAISGGVDSTVAAFITYRAIGDKLKLVFINNGLLRENEPEEVFNTLTNMGLNVKYVDASDMFLKKLKGVVEPEKKRKIIGKSFIDVFEKQITDKHIKWLLQGTLYPDVIESNPHIGPSQVIKSHHNVGGLPKKMHLKVLEPFRLLFKDEVRKIGRLIHVPEYILNRQPFPGPGLSIRVIGEIKKERLNMLKKADSIVREEIGKYQISQDLWQYFAVLLPVRTVGIMGDERTYEHVIAIRAVKSEDGMTADWARLPYELMDRLSSRIIGEVNGINRVVYDISSKPPGTIEWE
ncbi:MAG: glutamine-hydrolyzing GMP synthase [Deltaproteobacteria bacterium]|nr:glutamine-hydrolyzing GMP synthase [Deltaproteobacteria bacterium]MCL5792798.1 glutamine-hydrolyzing GMP synthase [Deltaproteobacteria bacterium]